MADRGEPADGTLVMNPFVDLHIRPPPEAYPIDVARITAIRVQCPVRGRGLLVHDVTPDGDPALFAFFRALVARDGELVLDSDAPLVDALVELGFLVTDDAIVDWPQLRIALPDAPPGTPLPDPRWRVDPSFVFQPDFALHPGVRWPADYDEQDGRLRCFAPGPACWLGAPAGFAAPRWVSPDDAAHLAALVPGAPPPALPDALARALVHAGALVAPAEMNTDAPQLGARGSLVRDGSLEARRGVDGAAGAFAAFAHHRAAYDAEGYVVVRDLLAAVELAALRGYYAALLDAGLIALGDRQSAKRYSAYNDPVGRFVHARLTGAMSAVTGQPVVPSFSYFFSYIAGADLEPHKDRAQAEFSISLQIDHTPTPTGPTGWPLGFTFDDGRPAAADLAIGDAVLYHGRTLSHHRAALPAGQRSSILVLEYVPRDFGGLLI